MNATNQRVELERTLTQEDFDRFALLSGDNNPIHVDPKFSARSRFGRPVAHGVLLCTIVRGLIEQLLPQGRQRSQKVTFPAPTYAGEAMRFIVEISAGNGKEVMVRFEVTRCNDGQATCVGEALIIGARPA